MLYSDPSDDDAISDYTLAPEAARFLLRVVKDAAGTVPVFVNTGVRAENVATQLAVADGAVVGTYFKKDGVFANAVDKSRVQELMGAAREFRTQLA